MKSNLEEVTKEYEYAARVAKSRIREQAFVDKVYDIVKSDTEGMDSIYKDYIKQMVGVYGLNALIENKLVESCGVVNGRQLYVLCDK